MPRLSAAEANFHASHRTDLARTVRKQPGGIPFAEAEGQGKRIARGEELRGQIIQNILRKKKEPRIKTHSKRAGLMAGLFCTPQKACASGAEKEAKDMSEYVRHGYWAAVIIYS